MPSPETAKCCNGHEADPFDGEPETSNDEAYKFAVNTRMSVLDSILDHYGSVEAWDSIMGMWREASDFALYGGPVDEGAAHEPEEEIPGEGPLAKEGWA